MTFGIIYISVYVAIALVDQVIFLNRNIKLFNYTIFTLGNDLLTQYCVWQRAPLAYSTSL